MRAARAHNVTSGDPAWALLQALARSAGDQAGDGLAGLAQLCVGIEVAARCCFGHAASQVVVEQDQGD